jgi:hypothetical protein
MIGLGAFPEVPLSKARDKAHDARKLIAAGTDPSQQRKEEKIAANIPAQNTFGSIAAEYLAKLKDEGAAQSTIEKNRWLLEDLAKPLSKRPATEIAPAEILGILKRRAGGAERPGGSGESYGPCSGSLSQTSKRPLTRPTRSAGHYSFRSSRIEPPSLMRQSSAHS